jgi:hypothetical protein
MDLKALAGTNPGPHGSFSHNVSAGNASSVASPPRLSSPALLEPPREQIRPLLRAEFQDASGPTSGCFPQLDDRQVRAALEIGQHELQRRLAL